MLRPFIEYIFPKICFHCEALLEEGRKVYCKECFEAFVVLSQEERCLVCFTVNDLAICKKCQKKERYIHRQGAVFAYEGAMISWISLMNRQERSHLVEGAAGWMGKQLISLGWPIPDHIVAVPEWRLRRFLKGFTLSELLAKSLSALFQRTWYPHLKKVWGDGIEENYQWTEKQEIEDRVILIVSALLDPPELEKCARALAVGCPKAIYALSLARRDF